MGGHIRRKGSEKSTVLSLPEHLQEDDGDLKVDRNPHGIDDRGDQGTCGQGWVEMDFSKNERDEGARQVCREKGDQEGRAHNVAEEEIVVLEENPEVGHKTEGEAEAEPHQKFAPEDTEEPQAF